MCCADLACFDKNATNIWKELRLNLMLRLSGLDATVIRLTLHNVNIHEPPTKQKLAIFSAARKVFTFLPCR